MGVVEEDQNWIVEVEESPIQMVEKGLMLWIEIVENGVILWMLLIKLLRKVMDMVLVIMLKLMIRVKRQIKKFLMLKRILPCSCLCPLVKRPASLALAYARQMEGASGKCADENRANGGSIGEMNEIPKESLDSGTSSSSSSFPNSELSFPNPPQNTPSATREDIQLPNSSNVNDGFGSGCYGGSGFGG